MNVAGDRTAIREERDRGTRVLRRTWLASGLAEILGTPVRLGAFIAVAAIASLLYSILLPFDYTQRFGFANWQYLNAHLLAWTVALGLGMALVVMVQVHAMRRLAAPRSGTLGGVAFVASLLPSFLCCTPIIPTVLAFAGVSALGVYDTTGTLQYFFATHQPQFLAGSLALLLLAAGWGLHHLARSSCLLDQGCGASTSTISDGELEREERSSVGTVDDGEGAAS